MTIDPDLTSTNLNAGCAAAAGAIARTDTKASLLLAFDGAILAGLASLADARLPLFTQIVGGVAVAALAVAAVLLLLVVRPNLGRGRVVQEGFPLWAQLDEDALRAAMSQDTRLTQVKTLSAIAVRKYEGLTRAIDVNFLALALLAAAAARAGL